MNGLAGQVSLITGGAMGIGKAIAMRFAGDGSDVVIADVDVEVGRQTVKEIESLGRKALFCRVDVTRWDEVEAMVAEVVTKFGRLDILVNSAGILGPTASVREHSVEDWDRVMGINLKGTFLCCKAAVVPMLNQGRGKIVNMGSVAGKEGNANMSAYSCSKAAVIAFTKSLAKEVVQKGIVVNCITPAVVETRFVGIMGEEQKKVLLSKIPMGRFGKPPEIASLARFLVSDECSFSTGQCFDISGGRSVY